LGTISQFLYLVAGMCGLPVFANGAFGVSQVFGVTGGYLLAFVLAAGLLGWLADRGWDRKVVPASIAVLGGNFLIMLLGTTWLSRFTGWSSAWALGFVPFISGAVLKSCVVIAAMPLTWKLIGKDRA